MRENPFALSQAPLCMKENRKVVTEAILRESSCMAYAAEALRSDSHFAVEVLIKDGGLLRYLAPELQAKKETRRP